MNVLVTVLVAGGVCCSTPGRGCHAGRLPVAGVPFVRQVGGRAGELAFHRPMAVIRQSAPSLE